MAQKKNASKNTGSGKKGRVIRKSIAGVLMATALVVAAIPSGGSGVAAAANTAVNNNDGLNYTADYNLLRNGDFTSADSSVLTPGTETVFSSYEIRTINGRDTLVNKYKYYIPTGGVGGSTVGVICGYNDSYHVETLNLSGRIYTGYDITAKSDYDTFWSTYGNSCIAKISFGKVFTS